MRFSGNFAGSMFATKGRITVFFALAAFFTFTSLAQAQNGTFSNGAQILVPGANTSGNAAPSPSIINMSGMTGNVTDVNVTLYGVEHTNPDDIDVLLVGPAGQNVRLMADVGGTGDIIGVDLTLDDEATDSLPDSTLLNAGTYKPTKGGMGADNFSGSGASAPFGTSLSVFDGSAPNGDWKLFVVDDASSNIGRISDGWSIAISTDNDPPEITEAIGGTAEEGSPAAVTVTATDDPSDTLSYSFDCDNDGGYGGTGDVAGQPGNVGECTFDDNGEYPVGVKVSDGKTNGVDTATATVTVNNVAPTATFDNDGPINEGSPVTGSFSGQTDPSPPDTAAGFRYEYECDGSEFENAPDYANASSNASTTCTFDDEGAKTVRGRIIDDDNGATEYTAAVNVSNVAPEISAVAAEPNPVDEGSSTTITVIATDPGNDTLTYDFDCDNDGDFDDSGDEANSADNTGACTFDDEGTGTYTVGVRVSDGDDGSDTDETTVTVKNEAPTVTLDAAPAEVDESTTAERTFTFSATDPGNDTLALDSFDCGNLGTPVGDGTIDDGDARPATGSFKCVFPDGGHDAPPTTSTLSVTVSDGDGGTDEDSRAVAVKNVSPTINSVTNTGPISEGGSATITVNASDPAGTNDTLRYRFDCDGSFGSQTGNNFETPGEGADEGINNASCAFDDNGNFTVNVLVRDEDGGLHIDSTTVEVANVAPSVVNFDGPTTANEGDTKSYTFEVTDPGTLDTHTPTPGCGDGREPVENSLEYNQTTNEGEFDCFFPNGDEMVNVSVSVADDDGDGGSGGTTVEVSNVAPVISAIDDVTIAEDGMTDAIPFTVTDVDAVEVAASSDNTDLVQSEDITLGGSGADRTVAVKPDANESGRAKITISADDGEDAPSAEEFIVTVTSASDPPDAKDDEATTREETTVGINVLANDTDADGDRLTLVAITEPPTGGTARILAGRVFYTPRINFNGPDSLVYSVRDGDGNTDTARVNVTVTPVNDAPVARSDSARTTKNQAVDINVLANDTDVDGDTLSVASFTQPGRGTVTRNDDGTLKYTPPNNVIGLAVFTYRANDGTTNSNLTLVSVVITR